MSRVGCVDLAGLCGPPFASALMWHQYHPQSVLKPTSNELINNEIIKLVSQSTNPSYSGIIIKWIYKQSKYILKINTPNNKNK